MTPLRIAWTGFLPAGRGSGAALLLDRLVAQMRRRGHALVEVGALDPSSGSPRERHRRVVATAQAEWRRDRPDLLHVELPGTLAHAALATAESMGIPASGTWHQVHIHAPPAERARALQLGLELIRRCRLVFCDTPADAAWLAGQGMPDAIPRLSGVDAGIFRPAAPDAALRAAWGVGDDDPAVLTVCRLVSAKSLDLLAAAARSLRTAHPRARWLVAGDGPQRPYLAAEPAVTLIGHSGPALARAYASADLFAFPSRDEPLGVVTAEALACGTPVVAFARGAAGLLVRDGATGLLAPCGDDRGFIDRVLALAGDLPRLRAMRSACPGAVAGWTWEALADRYEEGWRRMLAMAAPVRASRPAP